MIFLLTTYTNDTYSYLGVSENGYHAFSTYEKAANFATANGLIAKCTAEEENHCTIEQIGFDDENQI